MRPDRVYRTGVLSPMVGYQPQEDANAVAMEFTQGAARGMMLNGFGQPGPFKRLGLRIQAALAERRARKFMMAGLGSMPGPAYAMSQQIAPHLAMQMTGVMHLMAGRYGAGYPAVAADALVQRRLNEYYRAG